MCRYENKHIFLNLLYIVKKKKKIENQVLNIN